MGKALTASTTAWFNAVIVGIVAGLVAFGGTDVVKEHPDVMRWVEIGLLVVNALGNIAIRFFLTKEPITKLI